ncbi:hypothetical protein [Streptomyces sp. NPDC014894]|uniref:hypothetical protein n=1 Tax=Streptomyces sp. NPDC014894 TaxID=3364931 RepID=UPI0037006AD2
MLGASNLDPGVPRGEHPTAAVALINPRQKDVKDFLSTAFRAPDGANDPLMLFSRFDRTRTRLVGDDIRTRGRMTFREGERGALEVTADVTFVHPVARAGADSDEVTRTIVRREAVLSRGDPAKVITEPGTFSLVSYAVRTANGGCGEVAGYLAPRFSADSAAADGPAVDPYDRSTPTAERTRDSAKGERGAATRS